MMLSKNDNEKGRELEMKRRIGLGWTAFGKQNKKQSERQSFRCVCPSSAHLWSWNSHIKKSIRKQIEMVMLEYLNISQKRLTLTLSLTWLFLCTHSYEIVKYYLATIHLMIIKSDSYDSLLNIRWFNNLKHYEII